MFVGYIFMALAGLFALGVLFIIFVAVFPVPKVPLQYNLRNLQVRWLTVLITALAITLVVALLTVMLAFVKGMERLTEGSANPANIVVLEEGSTDEVMSKLPLVRVADLPNQIQEFVARKSFPAIDESGNKVQKEKELVSREVFAIVVSMQRAPDGELKKRFLQMRGIEDPLVSAEVHGIQLLPDEPGAEGEKKNRWFGTTRGKEAVLGFGIAKLLGKDVGKDTLRAGDTVRLRDQDWTVVGVMSPATSTYGSEIWTDDKVVQDNFGREGNYTSYTLRVTDPKKIEEMAKVLRDRDQVSYSFNAVSEKEYFSNMSKTNQQFSFAIYLIAVVMALGGMLGVMITMFAAVSQRAKDIGVLRLLGFKRWQILCSFLLEALILGIIGGVLGVLIGICFEGTEANGLVSGGQGGGKSIILKLTFDAGIIVRGFIFAIVMGVVGGLFPAIAAMRLRPLESLR